MPYITPERRTPISEGQWPIGAGELNYSLTIGIIRREVVFASDVVALCIRYMAGKEMRYNTVVNEVVGVLECAAREFERRTGRLNGREAQLLRTGCGMLYASTFAPYEDLKIAENGDLPYRDLPALTAGKKVYLAGPMRGIPHFNFPAFHAAAAMLRAQGYTVFNPAERDIARHGGVDITNATGSEVQAQKDHGFSLRDALRDDTQFICLEADEIAMLPGWENSSGARAEHALSLALGHSTQYLRAGDYATFLK